MAQGTGPTSFWDGLMSAVSMPGHERPPEPFSEVLQRVVSRHISQEEDSIKRYHQLQEEIADPVIRVLLSELLGDEERHHGMLQRMEAQMLAEMGERTDAPFDMEREPLPVNLRKAVSAEVKVLAEHEASGVKHLRDVAKEAREAGSDLLGVLLDAMAADSQKHERILKFIAKRVAKG